MRKVGQKDDERIEVLDNGPIDKVKLDAGIAPGVKGSAVDPDAPVPDEIPKPRWFRVVQGGMVLENGFRTRLKEGKEINSLNYNIRRLQQQGIRLVEFDPTELDVSLP